VLLLFLQVHRETDRFFTVSGVHLGQSTITQFHYHHVTFSSQIESKIGNILVKTSVLWILLNIDENREEVGVELSFYLVAPFVLKNRNLLLTAFIGSLAVRVVIFIAGLGTTDPWQYRFFPAELSIFLLGAITCQIGLPALRRLDPNIRANAVLFVTLAFVGFVAVFEYLPGRGALKEYIALFLAAVCLPFAFLFQQRFRWDSWIGDLSYPIYICHLLVLWLVSFVFNSFGYSPQSIEASLVTILGSIFFAIVLNAAVARPVEALRRRIRRQDSKSLNGSDAEPVGVASGPGGASP
jgi:peptidoglycan/LPS O-acetylase OafA/YrhL